MADPERVNQMRAASVARYEAEFTWDKICKEYEALLTRFLPA
ncbi:glycosyltransferase, RfaG [Hydrocarboniphaga effusa AP103]|uniref:Glycosyltransferase, RfaG n=1 Tax=Hydrocarboniphaga effusa AP103 TaxID=1172194 RepID=I8T5S2_9GAMM|nr:glycosyltransferase, RfaG [Hydrocarboniphaga effusa AP103]